MSNHTAQNTGPTCWIHIRFKRCRDGDDECASRINPHPRMGPRLFHALVRIDSPILEVEFFTQADEFGRDGINITMPPQAADAIKKPLIELLRQAQWEHGDEEASWFGHLQAYSKGGLRAVDL